MRKKSVFRISVWSSYFKELKPETMVDTFLAHGLDCSELSDEHGWALLEKPRPRNAIRKFKKYCDEKSFSFPQGHFYLTANLAEPHKKSRIKLVDDLKKWCDLFNDLDVKAGVLHPGTFRNAPDSEKRALENIVSTLEELLAYSKGMSFVICLENLIENFNCYSDISALIKKIHGGERLGICLDTGHLNWCNGNCAEFAVKAGAKLKALHITDCMGSGLDHILPFGGGKVDWKALIKALRKIHYSGLFNFEIPKETNCPMPIRLKKLDYIVSLAGEMMNL